MIEITEHADPCEFYSDAHWLMTLSSDEPITEERSAIETWYEAFDNEYDGRPLRDWEVIMLRLLGKGVIA